MERITLQKSIFGFLLALIALAVVSPAVAQQEQIQQKVAAVKQAMAQSQQALRQYTWTETTEMFLKGESKSQKHSQCQYGPDGKVQKTPMGSSDTGQPAKKTRGLKGKIIEKKKDEMQDYMERAASLIHRYVPPDPARLQEAFQEGKASIQPSGDGVVILVFRDYAKPGDSLSLAFNNATNNIQSVTVKSYLDERDDAVNLNVRFDILVDGTNYQAESVLDATAKQVRVKTTNHGHYKP